jgi:hypothetical protein
MKTRLPALALVVVALALACIPVAPAVAAPDVTIELLNLPPDGMLSLDVGESYTFEIHIISDEPFVLAAAQTDAFYPGRGIYWYGGDRTTRNTEAYLYLTMTGKNSTENLGPVYDWPELGDIWPVGVAPAAIVAGVRFKGGLAVTQVFSFGVQVPATSN